MHFLIEWVWYLAGPEYRGQLIAGKRQVTQLCFLKDWRAGTVNGRWWSVRAYFRHVFVQIGTGKIRIMCELSLFFICMLLSSDLESFLPICALRRFEKWFGLWPTFSSASNWRIRINTRTFLGPTQALLPPASSDQAFLARKLKRTSINVA